MIKIISFVIILLLTCSTESESVEVVEKGWRLFELDEIRLAHTNAGNSYYQFIDESKMSMGLYVLNAASSDEQSPHSEDEVYYILSGNAKLKVDQTDYDATPGTILYVAANTAHHFHSITEDLETLVLFSKTTPNSSDLPVQINNIFSILAGKDQNENIWDPFLKRSTMTFGMYMLAKNLGGDGPLVHSTEEINILVNGSGEFKIGNDIISIKPGSIFFVKSGLYHNFQDLASDNDILIFWNK